MCVYSQVSYSETSNDFCTMYQAAFSNSYSDCSPSDVWADELLSSFTSVCSNIHQIVFLVFLLVKLEKEKVIVAICSSLLSLFGYVALTVGESICSSPFL